MKNPSLDIEKCIIYENEDYLIINKPAGISSLEDRLKDHNILSMAEIKYEDIKLGHRLDKDTSGVMILAKKSESYRNLAIQFEKRAIKKVYYAVVSGRTNFINTEIDMPIYIGTSNKVKIDKRKGKPSSTILNTLEVFKEHSLVECQPLTGRKHQIRAHLAHAGCPIIADKVYGGKMIFLSQIKKNYRAGQREENPMIGRMALHAYSIEFELKDGSPLYQIADYPKDFEVLLKMLRKFA